MNKFRLALIHGSAGAKFHDYFEVFSINEHNNLIVLESVNANTFIYRGNK